MTMKEEEANRLLQGLIKKSSISYRFDPTAPFEIFHVSKKGKVEQLDWREHMDKYPIDEEGF